MLVCIKRLLMDLHLKKDPDREVIKIIYESELSLLKKIKAINKLIKGKYIPDEWIDYVLTETFLHNIACNWVKEMGDEAFESLKRFRKNDFKYCLSLISKEGYEKKKVQILKNTNQEILKIVLSNLEKLNTNSAYAMTIHGAIREIERNPDGSRRSTESSPRFFQFEEFIPAKEVKSSIHLENQAYFLDK